jgi:NUMOD4 motif/HNH endonuclease
MNDIEWRDVVGWEEYYQVSNAGDVKRVCGGRGAVIGKILKKSGTNKPYYTINLRREGHFKSYKVHRLVALSFVENLCPDTKTQVNHMDGNKKNNHYLNLEWVTPGENQKHSYRVLDRKSARGFAKLTEEDVLTIRKLLYTTRLTQKDIGSIFGINQTTVSRIKLNQTWLTVKQDTLSNLLPSYSL